MTDTLRDSIIGQIIHFGSGGKLLQYREQRPDFEIPDKYKNKEKGARSNFDSNANQEKNKRSNRQGARDASTDGQARRSENERRSSDETVVGDRDQEDGGNQNQEEDGGQNGEDEQSQEEKDAIIVDWYGPDDPENPKNWSLPKKCLVTGVLMLLTSSVYMGSSIVSPGIEHFMEYFGLGQVTVTLTLTLFVLGYGIGPLFLSPITEIPHIGRTLPYVVCMLLFVILQVPSALVNNFAGLCILRFLAGFVGSPPLATGGASISDMYSPHKLPYAMGLWGLSAGTAPAVAPVLSGFAVMANGWRWSFWIMLWLSGGTLIVMIFLLPETSGETILLRRAQRLRKLTGNDKIHSQGEIETKHMTGKEIAQMSLLRPLTMTFTEPIVLAINLYVGLIYAVLYSYFESFPIVYAQGYGWNLGVSTLPFLSLLIGAIVSFAIYAIWNRLYFEPIFLRKRGKVQPETRLPMSMAGAFCFPICLFWFAWTANRTLWVSPLFAQSIFGLGVTWMFMPFLTYLPGAYPKYAASVLASNDFVRSMFGAGMPLAAVPLFKNLGIDWGNTLLGCLTVLFIPIPFILYKAGPWLRSKSPNALHDEQVEEMPEDDSLPTEP